MICLTDKKCNPIFSLIIVCFLFSLIPAQQDSIPLPQNDTTESTQSEVSSKSFTSLSGSLPSRLTIAESPYLAEADIFVSPGTTVSIDSGVTVLFNNFTGLHVQGTLYVKGTKDNPVVFTSKNDPMYNQVGPVTAAPYDWNGVDVYESSIGTAFDNCIVQYSVYGIKSQTEHFKIQNSFFLQNGKSNVSVKENIFPAGTSAFSYSDPAIEMSATNEIIEDTTKTITSEVKKVPDSKASKRKVVKNILRYSGVLIAAGGIAAAAFEYRKYKDANDNFNTINQKNDYNMQTYTSSDWEKANKKVNDETTLLGIFGGTGMLGLLMFGISFTF